ncbi:MAG: hypothetical protein WDO17_02905 [Alphaproteobacteria bacterium]
MPLREPAFKFLCSGAAIFVNGLLSAVKFALTAYFAAHSALSATQTIHAQYSDNICGTGRTRFTRADHEHFTNSVISSAST